MADHLMFKTPAEDRAEHVRAREGHGPGQEGGIPSDLDVDPEEGVVQEARDENGETRAERETRELSERTGKPKKAPRGRPFQRGSDPRRKQEGGQEMGGSEGAEGGEGEGTSEGGEVKSEKGNPGQPKGGKGKDGKGEGSEGGESDGEGEGQQEQEAPQEPKSPLEELIRMLARDEAGKLDAKLMAKLTPALQEIARAAAESTEGKGERIRIELASVKAPELRTLKGVQHKAFAEVATRLSVGFRNLLLVGPAGSGKTTLGHQLADALGRPFASVSCSAGMSEGVLLGRLLPTGEHGRFEYASAPFVEMYEQGGVFLLDEVDAADSNVLLVLNSALANGHLDVPNRLGNPVARRHPDFVLIAAGNTFGQGANRMYVGRNQLDAAFLSRFAGTVIEMGYDTAMEDSLAVTVGESVGLKAAAVEAFVKAFRETRAKIEAGAIRRMWGTRELLAGVRLLAQKGATAKSVGLALMTGWTPDEMTRAGAR